MWAVAATAAVVGLALLSWRQRRRWQSLVQHEQQLASKYWHANERFGSLFNCDAMAIGITDSSGKIVQVNQHWTELFGYSAGELDDPMCFISPIDQPEAQRIKRRLLSGELNHYSGLYSFIKRDGKPFFGELFVRAVKDEQGRVIGSTSVVLDVSERKQMEASLLQRDRMLTGLADALARLLEYHPQLGTAMTEALAAIGRAADTDRAYIFEEHEVPAAADACISMRYEWCRNGIESQLHNPLNQELSWGKLSPRWRELLCLNQEVVATDDELTPSEHAVLDGQNIRSLLLVPIFIEDRMWGFVGFDDCRQPRRWSNMEISILRAAGKGFGIALQRQRAEASLILAKERAELLNQKLSEENVRTANLAKEARLANETKSRFLANMSHEIRTPMNGVLGMCTVLGGTHLSDEQAEYLAIIRKSADGLLGIIEDILDFSKIEAGKLELDYEDVGIVELVEDVLDLFTLQAQEKTLAILHQIDPQVPARIRIDGLRLRQVLVNLVSNAIKFTESGQVIVRVWQSPTTMGKILLYFEVEDSGPGIHPEMRNYLFEAFNQLNSSTARKFGGTGLGLSISQKLARMMGGDLRLMKSDASGATFRCFVQTEALSEPWPQRAGIPAGSSRQRIVLIDPNEVSRKFNAERFLSLGCMIRTFADLASAREAAASADVVIVDSPSDLLPENRSCIDLGPLPRPPYIPVILATLGDSRHWEWSGFSEVQYRMKPLRCFAILRQIYGNSGPALPRRIDAGRSRQPPTSLIQQFADRVIWVIDDNAVNLRVANLLLKRIGVQARTFTSGMDALAALDDVVPEIIFMDLQMPVMDGLETTANILARTQKPFIIAMTAAATTDDRAACTAVGMRDFIPKPVKEDQLLRVLSAYLLDSSKLSDAV